MSNPMRARSEEKVNEEENSASRNVFVIHGRNDSARGAMFEFLRSVGLQPIEWAKAVDATAHGSPYVGAVLDKAFSMARAVVVLMTPDDEARLTPALRSPHDPSYEAVLTGQARPNVLFEAGMSMARDETRTVLVELGGLRPFSDIAGRHVIKMNNTSQRRQELAQRLERAGCPVDLKGTNWHTAGDFDSALPSSAPSPDARTAPGVGHPPLDFLFQDGVAPYVQRDHMFKIDPNRGTQVSAEGVTYRVGVRNNSGVTLEAMKVQLVKSEPPPKPNVLPVVLRRKDDNIPPFHASSSFDVHPGQTEFIDVIMKLDELDDIEVQHTALGVTPPVLPPTCVLTLTAAGRNLLNPPSVKLHIDTLQGGQISVRMIDND